MQKIIALFTSLLLVSCGTIGIGKNHQTIIYNNSSDTITASATSGIYKIKPEASLTVYSTDEIGIKSNNTKCQEPNITSNPNGAAIFLDIIPGCMLFGIIPIFVDAITNNLYHMPESYYYTCD